METRAALVSESFLPLVEHIERLSPGELDAAMPALEAEAGTARHLLLGGVLALARGTDWAPLDAEGRLDLTPATALAVETLRDRLPARARWEPVRVYLRAVSRRLHHAQENAPFVLPEIAPDPERMRDPAATFAEVCEQLDSGAASLALHGWACCRGRVPWSKVSEELARLALADGATAGGRALTVASVRRFLEILGREHRHPVVTALLRGLAVPPRGEDPAPERDAILAGVALPDEARDPALGEPVDRIDLAGEILVAADARKLIGTELARGAALGGLMDALAQTALELGERAEGAPQAVADLRETLPIVNALRDLDGHEDGRLRPRVVAEAARLLSLRIARARAAGVDLRDSDPSAAPLDALAAAHLAAEQDAGPWHPEDLAPLRYHIARWNEFARASRKTR